MFVCQVNNQKRKESLDDNFNDALLKLIKRNSFTESNNGEWRSIGNEPFECYKTHTDSIQYSSYMEIAAIKMSTRKLLLFFKYSTHFL